MNSLLLLRHLVDVGWFDVRTAAPPLLQLNDSETTGAIGRLAQVSIGGAGRIMAPVVGVPDANPAAWTLTEEARGALRSRDSEFGTTRQWPSRARGPGFFYIWNGAGGDVGNEKGDES